MSKGQIGDFALADFGAGGLSFVFSTSDSEVILANATDGKIVWKKQFKVPVREFLNPKDAKRMGRDTLAGQPVVADGDGDGKLDVIVETRGLNSYVYCLGASDGRLIWNYGNKNLRDNPTLSESVVLEGSKEATPFERPFFTATVPVFSYPTPVIADFDGDGKADLIVNDRDEVGLISVPLAGNMGAGLWTKFANSPCNNTAHFGSSCLGTAPAPTVRLSLERREITEGQSVRLCWTTTNAMQVEIDQGVGPMAPEECVTVKPALDTTWTAIARGCGGEGRDSVSLAVKMKPPPAPPVPPRPATLTDEERHTLTRAIKDVLFEYDYYRLTPEAKKALDEDTQSLKAYPAARLALEGTCDERGSKIYNQYLGLARAEAAQEYLVSNGIDPSRLQVKPEGETTKYDSHRNEKGYAQNRRVHFVILP
jgi:outer membrane protein OmpA-like peptidoglycan-associated protein